MAHTNKSSLQIINRGAHLLKRFPKYDYTIKYYRKFVELIGRLSPRINRPDIEPETTLSKYHLDANSSCIYPNNLYEPKYDLHIIIPCYNVEKTIEKCINSVLTQKTKYKYLITAINDGSSDKTGEILERLQDDNLRIIHQENMGLPGARNTGLNHIEGQYVTFLDSDDYLSEGAIEKLLDLAFTDKNIDIIQGSYFVDFQENGSGMENIYADYIGTDKSKLYGFPWGKLYKAKLFKNTHFPEKYWFEDTYCGYILHQSANKIAISSHIAYNYSINPKGITKTAAKSNKIIDTYWITKHLLEDSVKLGLLNNQTKQLYYEMTLYQVLMNGLRADNRCKNVRHAMFWSMKALLENYFKGLHTSNEKLKTLEKSILDGNYLKYKIIISTL